MTVEFMRFPIQPEESKDPMKFMAQARVFSPWIVTIVSVGETQAVADKDIADVLNVLKNHENQALGNGLISTFDVEEHMFVDEKIEL